MGISEESNSTATVACCVEPGEKQALVRLMKNMQSKAWNQVFLWFFTLWSKEAITKANYLKKILML